MVKDVWKLKAALLSCSAHRKDATKPPRRARVVPESWPSRTCFVLSPAYVASHGLLRPLKEIRKPPGNQRPFRQLAVQVVGCERHSAPERR